MLVNFTRTFKKKNIAPAVFNCCLSLTSNQTAMQYLITCQIKSQMFIERMSILHSVYLTDRLQVSIFLGQLVYILICCSVVCFILNVYILYLFVFYSFYFQSMCNAVFERAAVMKAIPI